MAVTQARLFALLAFGLLAVSVLAGPASGQWRRGTTPNTAEIETREPARGYSGHVRQGGRLYYCDYMRIPNRTCTTDRAGREHCRVAGWTLQQRCY